MQTRAPTHPSADKLRGFGLGQLDDADAVSVMNHLDKCSECQKEVAAVTGDYFLDRLREARSRSGTPLPGKSLSELARSLYATVPPSTSAPSVSGLPPELANHPQYEVVSELGPGGMGVVYLARHLLSGRLEVLKVMNKELLARSGSKERFLREIQSAAMLDHPNVVKMYTAMEMGDLMVLVMEYVKGEDLAKLVKAKGRLPVPNACYYTHQVTLGLQHAFEKNMVHRDIKPQNVILAKEGKKHLVKVLDFGLAKVVRERGDQFELTGQGQMLGTPDYIAPEQPMDATNADIRADIYSLGCSLYFLLSGHAPFKGKSLFEILQAHQTREAPALTLERPEVSPELAAIVSKMMAKDPALRYQQPIQAAQALSPFFRADSKAQPPKSSHDSALEKPMPPTQEDNLAKTGKTVVPLAEVVNEVKDEPRSIQRASTSHWELLRESDVASNEAPNAKKESKRAVRSHPANKKRMLIAAGVLVGILFTGLIGLWAAGVFKVRTKEGTLVVEVNEPNAEVFVDGERVTVTWGDCGKKAEIRVRLGTRKVEVKKDGFTAYGEEVTLEDGGRKVLSAHLEPKDQPPPDKEWVSLFNGKDLTGWQIPDAPTTHWTVDDGAIIGTNSGALGSGSQSLETQQKFTDFCLRLETMRSEGQNNSHIFFRGLGVIIAATEQPPQESYPTGTLNVPAKKLLQIGPEDDMSPGKWFTLEIVVTGQRCKVIRAGHKVADCRIDNLGPDIAGPPTPISLGCRPQSTVRFRKIEIKELPPTKPDEQGFVRLFNGKDLTGWKLPFGGTGDWKAQNGMIVSSGPASHLFSERGDFDNFHLRAEAQINDGGNSGLYFRTDLGTGWPKGYEAQINATHGDPQKTGSLYNIAKILDQLHKPDEWFTLEVIAEGEHVVILVNDKKVVDVTDSTYKKGHIALQQHDPQTVVKFRKIEIKELPSKPAADPLPKGSVWKGKRTYRKGAYAPATVTYELHVRDRKGTKFTGHVFDNGPGRNRAEVEGEVEGKTISWRERSVFNTEGLMTMKGKLEGDALQLTFKGFYGKGRPTNEGDGKLKMSK